ncbi:thiamine phosphate synthase [Sphingomonas sp. Leaf412]|uniref:thiamine phosphate synthase n=1 Tax=Sphingomonas sp. Leaf412 TaxID=1736370 RepID=UPI0009E9F530|nr:thiamine phosphate synthase [Sphingomonas sp. Leaf412]
MSRRHLSLPTRWLMTDERMGEGLWRALERLPRGGGVVFRHHDTPPADRRALFARVLRVARRRDLLLVRAGATAMRGEMGVHGRRGRGLVTWPAHHRAEAMRGAAAGARLLFVSPLFATRSHPGARAASRAAAAGIARGLPVVAIALGGMTERRFRAVAALGFAGYAGIDCWLSGPDAPRLSPSSPSTIARAARSTIPCRGRSAGNAAR